jgi:hypothetical protein
MLTLHSEAILTIDADKMARCLHPRRRHRAGYIDARYRFGQPAADDHEKKADGMLCIRMATRVIHVLFLNLP